MLLGKGNRATPIENERRRGVAITGFEICCSETGSFCINYPSQPFKKLGHLVHIKYCSWIVLVTAVVITLCLLKLLQLNDCNKRNIYYSNCHTKSSTFVVSAFR